MSPRVGTGLMLLRQNTRAEVIFDGGVFIIVSVNAEVCGTDFLVIDERHLNLATGKSTGRHRSRDHLSVVR